MKKKLFGTDGIRGKVNHFPMSPETVIKIGMAAAMALKKKHGRNMILIGKDTRLSGYMIESALTSGICSMGMNVILVGPLPTPGVAFLTKTLRLDAGVVISASHNPFDDNGIKFFSSQGFKLPDEVENQIEEMAEDDEFFKKRPAGHEIGKAFRLEDAKGRYIEYIKSTIPKNVSLEGLKIVVDCANGAAYKITPWVLEELGAEVITINGKPDGTNINASCGSLHTEGLREAVLTHKADIGVAHDGDADRTILVDEKGEIVDGDHMLAIWALELKNEGRLPGETVVATIMSNLGVERFLEGHGIKFIRANVGDRFVTEKMLKGGFALGGEQSGHIVNLHLNSTGDGPITALHMVYLVKKLGLPLSGLKAPIPVYPQVLENVTIKTKLNPSNIPGLDDMIKKAEKELAENGRVLVRPSGTEPKIRVMVEGKDGNTVDRLVRQISSYIKEKTA
ncbi:MAG: phosphoglucosamine mutase [Nitrospiraceae bacterium]|nr:phosphoglucosamine mutase [Nitrospiraceae bacterium]